MKIVNHNCPNSTQLSKVKAGLVVQLCGAVHNKHKADDYFIVNEVCNTYLPKTPANRNYSSAAVAVTNLRTGSLAYLDPERDAVIILEASLETSSC